MFNLGRMRHLSLWAACAFAMGSIGSAAGSVPIEIDEERSRLEAKVSATLHSFSARVTDFVAEIEMDEAGKEVRLARLSFRVDDVDTGNDTRNAEMLEWLRAKEHPRISFEMEESEKMEGERRAIGELELAGVRRPIELPFQLDRQNGQVRISGSYLLDHREWDLPVVRKFFLKVDPELDVEFELWGRILSGEAAEGG